MPRLDDERRQQILDLFDAGTARNEIARQLRVGVNTVTRVCREEGRTFDRAAALLQLRAAELDLRQARDEVARKLLVVASDTLDTLDGPHLVHNFGGRDNTFNEVLLDEAPIEARLDAARLAGIALDKASRIIERIPDRTALDEAESILDAAANAFRAAAAQLRAQEDADEVEEWVAEVIEPSRGEPSGALESEP